MMTPGTRWSLLSVGLLWLGCSGSERNFGQKGAGGAASGNGGLRATGGIAGNAGSTQLGGGGSASVNTGGAGITGGAGGDDSGTSGGTPTDAGAGGAGAGAGGAVTQASGGTNVASGGAATTLGGRSSSGGAVNGGTLNSSGGLGAGGTTAAGGANASGGALNCGSTALACSGTCIDPDSSVQHCGRCGHDCGAKATCVNAQCRPATLVSALPGALGLDVSADGIFYTTANTVQRCTLASACVGGATQVGAFPLATTLAVTKTLSTNLFAVYGQTSVGPFYNYIPCPVTGCGATPSSFVSLDNRRGVLSGLRGFEADFYYQSTGPSGAVDSVISRVPGASGGTVGTTVPISSRLVAASPIAIDANNVIFARTDASATAPALVSCDRLASCASPVTLMNGVPNAIAAYDGKLYWGPATPGNAQRCSISNCSATTEVVQYISTNVNEIVVDASGIFWLTPTTLDYCPLTGCVGGAKSLATGLSGASTLRSHGNYLYWLVSSTASSATGAIYRLAKP